MASSLGLQAVVEKRVNRKGAVSPVGFEPFSTGGLVGPHRRPRRPHPIPNFRPSAGGPVPSCGIRCAGSCTARRFRISVFGRLIRRLRRRGTGPETNRYNRRRATDPVPPSLQTEVGGIALERPAMLASGILGISTDVFTRLHRAGAGAVVTKSLSSEPWEGYANPTVVGLGGGGWLNAVGLSNPGAREFARMLEGGAEAPVIVSLVGSAAEEFESMIAEFSGCRVAGYEINLSCPHVARVGLEVGDDHALVSELFGRIKKAAQVPVIAKVGLGSDYLGTVRAAVEGAPTRSPR